MYQEVTKLVGIDGAKQELISMLSLQRGQEPNDEIKIVSVHGIGGLDKTTLAKAVYDEMKSQFDCGAFVPVGRNPDLKKVFRDILIELDKHKYTDTKLLIWDEKQLIDELRDFLRSKRYELVSHKIAFILCW
jgi:disease resistance protein RPM1